jgi:FkbM family methyltransferase
MVLNLQAEKDYWLGTYEPQLQAAVSALARSGMVVYDVGANIGYTALLFKRAVGSEGQVFAFEALPANLERLTANAALNPDLPFQIRHAAVKDRSAPATFQVHASHGMGKLEEAAGRDEAYTTLIEVPGLDLDTFVYSLGNPAPDLIKLDIEGGEVLAFPGMQRILQEARPTLLVELHGAQAAQAAWDALRAAAYTIHQMSGGYPEVASQEELDWKAYIVAKPV